jgi:hypothetical protein
MKLVETTIIDVRCQRRKKKKKENFVVAPSCKVVGWPLVVEIVVE